VIAERNGVPAVSIMTTAFVDAAELMARVQGVPLHPFAVIQHPIASAGAKGIDDRAQIAVTKAVQILISWDPTESQKLRSQGEVQ
jgi:hypothetical protein